MDFGVEFSQSFLDLREKAGDIQSRINLHNNEAGRLVSTFFLKKVFYSYSPFIDPKAQMLGEKYSN